MYRFVQLKTLKSEINVQLQTPSNLPILSASHWMNFAEATQNRPKPNNPTPSGSFYAVGRFSLFVFFLEQVNRFCQYVRQSNTHQSCIFKNRDHLIAHKSNADPSTHIIRTKHDVQPCGNQYQQQDARPRQPILLDSPPLSLFNDFPDAATINPVM